MIHGLVNLACGYGSKIPGTHFKRFGKGGQKNKTSKTDDLGNLFEPKPCGGNSGDTDFQNRGVAC